MVLMIFLLIYESSVKFFKDFFCTKGLTSKCKKGYLSFIFIRQKSGFIKTIIVQDNVTGLIYITSYNVFVVVKFLDHKGTPQSS